jgi:hypothetical protein
MIALSEGNDPPEIIGVVHSCNHAGDENSHVFRISKKQPKSDQD